MRAHSPLSSSYRTPLHLRPVLLLLTSSSSSRSELPSRLLFPVFVGSGKGGEHERTHSFTLHMNSFREFGDCGSGRQKEEEEQEVPSPMAGACL